MNCIVALVALANSVFAADCRVRLQLAHVQDATATFADDIAAIKSKDLLTKLLLGLRDEFGPVEYALQTFGDKMAPLTGWGPWGGFNTEAAWKDIKKDLCYNRRLSFTTDSALAGSVFGQIRPTGGKDAMENQWDALHRCAVDETIGWKPKGAVDENGLPYVRVALLMTDDMAHRNSPVDANNRNAAFEYAAYGPSAEKCPLGRSLSECGDDAWGRYAPVSNATRSLAGVYSYWNAYYGYPEWTDEIRLLEMYSGALGEQAARYRSFINCCTGGTTHIFPRCDETSAVYFPSRLACIEYGGMFASGAPSGAAPSAEFLKGKANLEVSDIQPFAYGASIISEADCDVMEYPDPFSADYADVFMRKDIIPVVVAAPPAVRIYDSQPPTNTTNLYSYTHYNYQARVASQIACPNHRNDPWRGYSCALYGQDSARISLSSCSSYEQCTSLDCERRWWTDCMLREYGEPMEAMAQHGVQGEVNVIQADYTVEALMEAIKKAVRSVVDGIACPELAASTSTLSEDESTADSASTRSLAPSATSVSTECEITLPTDDPTTSSSTAHWIECPCACECNSGGNEECDVEDDDDFHPHRTRPSRPHGSSTRVGHPSVTPGHTRDKPSHSPSVTPGHTRDKPNNSPSVTPGRTRDKPNHSPSVTPGHTRDKPNNSPSVTPGHTRDKPNNSPSVTPGHTRDNPNNSPSVTPGHTRDKPNNSPSVTPGRTRDKPNNSPSVTPGHTRDKPNNSPSVTPGRTRDKPNNSPSVTPGQTRDKPNHSPSVTSGRTRDKPNNSPSVTPGRTRDRPNHSPSVTPGQSK